MFSPYENDVSEAGGRGVEETDGGIDHLHGRVRRKKKSVDRDRIYKGQRLPSQLALLRKPLLPHLCPVWTLISHLLTTL